MTGITFRLEHFIVEVQPTIVKKGKLSMLWIPDGRGSVTLSAPCVSLWGIIWGRAAMLTGNSIDNI